MSGHKTFISPLHLLALVLNVGKVSLTTEEVDTGLPSETSSKLSAVQHEETFCDVLQLNN